MWRKALSAILNGTPKRTRGIPKLTARSAFFCARKSFFDKNDEIFYVLGPYLGWVGQQKRIASPKLIIRDGVFLSFFILFLRTVISSCNLLQYTEYTSFPKSFFSFYFIRPGLVAICACLVCLITLLTTSTTKPITARLQIWPLTLSPTIGLKSQLSKAVESVRDEDIPMWFFPFLPLYMR